MALFDSVPADLKQNIFYTGLFIVMHNFMALVFLAGIIVFAFMLLLRPSRSSVLILFGFIILLFSFEYNKHIVEPLKEQTLNSLITIQQHNKVRRIINIVLVKGLPLFLPLAGWSLVGIGMWLKIFSKKKFGNWDKYDKITKLYVWNICLSWSKK